jgi:hypothetical protein
MSEFVIAWLLWFAVAYFVHESGHCIYAKKKGIYDGWGIGYYQLWGLKIPKGIYIRPKPHKFKFFYMAGFIASLLVFPILLLINLPIMWFYIDYFLSFVYLMVISYDDFKIFIDAVKKGY